MAITLKKIEKFIRIRNKSGFNSNMQFQIDADESGFDASELPDPAKTQRGYEWRLPFGLLIEDCNGLRLEQDTTIKITNPKTGKSPTREEVAARFE